ncbi:MAG: His/Gly/Thr/Pro-type tRNA ligase C-terminal domain-containing protein, partial [Pyrinomonadaceae bacterium]|nr:His/Gly/Thr/Pro-type tRNA ligase C-terminal domain-containing protein [Pyrinomonadaceae bacterium]
STAADVLVTVWSEETLGDSLRFAAGLREQGIRVTLYPEADKIGKQLKYADAIGVRYVCILGPEEVASGKAKFKDMRTGGETSHTAAEFSGSRSKNT